ncbi:MAG: hypothetical protein ACI4PG_07235 [Candidatus Ventricola sp.]
MNRLLAALLLCLLIPACALAFDLSPYYLPDLLEGEFTYGITPLSADASVLVVARMVQRSGDPNDLVSASTLRFIERGSVVREVPLPVTVSASYAAVLQAGGVLRSISYSAREEAWKNAYALFDLAGDELVNEHAFESNLYDLFPLSNSFAGVCARDAGTSELIVYDADAQPVFRCGLPFERARVQDAVRSGDALYLLIKQQGHPSLSDCLVLRVTRDGSLSWTYRTTDEVFRFNSLEPDGQGGVLLLGPLVSDYKQYRIVRIDRAGSECWERTLSAPDVIVHPACAVENGGGMVTLYGRCVAKSRGLYTVFALSLDAFGTPAVLDVRDYSARADTSPGILRALDGTMLVHSEQYTQEEHGVLVPFAVLPRAENPGITLR